MNISPRVLNPQPFYALPLRSFTPSSLRFMASCVSLFIFFCFKRSRFPPPHSSLLTLAPPPPPPALSLDNMQHLEPFKGQPFQRNDSRGHVKCRGVFLGEGDSVWDLEVCNLARWTNRPCVCWVISKVWWIFRSVIGVVGGRVCLCWEGRGFH